MKHLDRRSFMQIAGGACITNAALPVLGQATERIPVSSRSPLRLGIVVWVGEGETADSVVKHVHELGLPTCQIGFEYLSIQSAAQLRQALDHYGVQASALSEHNPGVRIFNFSDGPRTIGIVPPLTRRARIDRLKLAADVASQSGTPAVQSHCGFIPEDPEDPLYPQAVAAVREIGTYCKQRGLKFLCETGQETPITLLRMIEDVGLDNVLVNFDLANLILYGKGNPVDAMDVIGNRVGGIHAKDGRFPTNPRELGKQVVMGEGRVDFLAVFKRLRQANYTGAVTLEGEAETEDILKSKAYMEDVIARTYGNS